MGFLKDVFDALFTSETNSATQISIEDSKLLNWLGIDKNQTDAIQEATYFTCMKMLSECLGKLPLHYYQKTSKGRVKANPTDATKLLTVRPNNFMTPTTLWTMTEFLCNHYGNAYVYIDSEIVMDSKYKGHVKFNGLYPLHPNDVVVYVDNAGIFKSNKPNAVYYQYTEPTSGQVYILTSDEIMHFKTWYTKNGIVGESVRSILSDTISMASQGQKVMKNFYDNGMTASAVLQYTGQIDDDRIKVLQKKYADRLSSPTNAGKIIPIPVGLQIQKLDTSFSDSQFYELKKYSALQIASAFGVKPNQIGNYDHASYSNSEQQQLSFLVDTMQYRLKAYEEEINAKMLLSNEIDDGYYYKFNEKAILRTDSKTQMDTLCEGVQNGVYTPNEARNYLDLQDMDGADILMCNGNFIPVTQVGSQYNTSSDGKGD